MTLQQEINSAPVGGTLTLLEGVVFNENITISKSIFLEGKAKIISPNADPALSILPGTRDVGIRGLELTASGFIYDIVRVGASGTEQATLQNSLDKVPTNISFEDVWVHGAPTTDSQRGIGANGANVSIINSRIDEIHVRGADSQGIGAWNGPGPFKIIGNYISAAGENVMFGGALPAIQGLIPSDIEVRRNHFFKPLSWNFWDQVNFKSPFGELIRWTTDPVPGLGEPAGDRYKPRYVGPEGNKAKHWSVKNLFELKNARNVIIDSNTFENCWEDGQIGYAVLFTVRTEDGKAPWNMVQNVQFTNNRVLNSDQGIQTLGQDVTASGVRYQSQEGSGLLIRNNEFVNIKQWFIVLAEFQDVRVEHNTHDQGGNFITMTGQNPSQGFVYQNNVTVHKPDSYGVKGDGAEEGTSSLEKYTPGYVFKGNVIAGAVERLYPTGNCFPADLSSLPTIKGTDGLVPGYSATGTTSTPTTSPTPVLSPTPTPVPAPAPTTSTSLTASPDGTKGTKIIDDKGGVWTIGPRTETLRDGILMGNGAGTLYKWSGGSVYVLTDTLKWWKWNGTGWELFGPEPGTATQTTTTQPTPIQPAPSTTPIPAPTSVTRKVAWPKTEAAQENTLNTQWVERYRLKTTKVTGDFAVFEKVN